VPAHATAVGQALLAYQPEAAEAVVGAGLTALTGDTIADPDRLARTLEEVRDRGYATNVRQWYRETAGVAAPVRGIDGEVLASLGISGPASRVGRTRLLAALGIKHMAHVHSYFPDYEIKDRASGSWIKVIDEGWLTLLDDLEVRRLASTLGNPDDLLSYDWVPAMPGINYPGDYRKDYAADPVAWIERDAAGEFGEAVK
jgi:hypothetical protein